MKLVGKLDSPYVRRVAISLTLMEVPFEHVSLSVFQDEAAFVAINPVLKAPSLMTEDGTVLMESTLILDHIEHGLPPARRLMPEDAPDRTQVLHTLGFALVAADKAVQLVYERTRRPPDRQYQPWAERIVDQVHAAFSMLDARYARCAGDWLLGTVSQADISTAVAWTFARNEIPDIVTGDAYPALLRLAARAEALPAFLKWQPK